MTSPYEALRRDLRAFVDERDWDQFHAPKELAVGLAVEAGELLAEFQWVAPTAQALKEDAPRFARVRAEAADVVLYAMLLSDKLGFDLLDACREKLAENRAKYPVEKARGRAAKYTEL